MIRERKTLTCTALALMLVATGLAVDDDFDLDRWTNDGGGEMWSVGGGDELAGTIGQPDAGVMIGGDYELTGGFWFAAPAGPAICRGDTNCDGAITSADVNPFVQALSNLSQWRAQYPACPWQNCDIDASGSVDDADINAFAVKLSSPGPCP